MTPPRGTRTGGFARSTLVLSVAQAASLVAVAVSFAVAARMLGSEGRGTLALAVVPYNLGSVIGLIGVSEYAIRERSRGVGQAVVLRSTMPVLLGSSALVLIAGLSLIVVADGLGDLVGWGFVALPIRLFGQLLAASDLGGGRLTGFAALTALPQMLFLLWTLALYASPGSPSVGAVAFGWFGAFGVVSLMLLPRRGWSLIRGTAAPPARESLSFGSRVWIGNMSDLANQRLDQLLLGIFVSRSHLGLYAAAVNAAAVVLVVPRSASIPLRRAAADDDTATHNLSIAVGTAFWVAFVVAAVVASTTPWSMGLVFGDEFDAAAGLAATMCLVTVPLAMQGLLGAVSTARGWPGLASRAASWALVVTIVLLLCLVPLIGVWAAVVASGFAYSVGAALLLSRLSGRLDVSPMVWFRLSFARFRSAIGFR